MKKLFAIALAATMVLATSCGTPAASSTPTSPDASGSSSASSSAADAATSSEVVTLKVMKNGTRPSNEATDLVHQWMVDNLKVDVQMTQMAENYNQQLALLITSGDIPDVMDITYDTYMEYAEQGAFKDLTNEVGKYESLMAYVGDNWDKAKASDGKLYAIPNMLNVPTSHVLNIRKDWLDKLNLQVPKTLDEFTNVMRAFTKNDPDGNGKNDTFGFSSAGFSYLGSFFGAFGASSAQDYFLNDNGTITTNAISNDYKAGLTYLNGLYKEGLLDPEMFTATYEQLQQKWGRGEMGVWGSWWSHGGNAYSRFGFADLQPNAVVEIVMPPVGADGKQGALYSPPFSSVIALSHELTQEQTDAALRMLDSQTTQEGFNTVMFGVKDVGYETGADGKVSWYYGQDGKDRLGHEVTDMELYKLLFNEPLQRYVHTLTDAPLNRTLWKSTEVQYKTPSKENIFAYCKTEEYVTNNAELEKYFTENSIRFIMGDKNLNTDWDAYVKGFLSMGGEQVRQSQLKMYNEKNATTYTFAEN